MLKLTDAQMLAIERGTVCSRVLHFIGVACHRQDFKRWARDRARMEALWWPLWPACRAYSEHDLVLAMMFIAVAAHENIQLVDPVQVLQGAAGDEVRLKSTLAERGYFDFTAFDGGAQA